MSGILLDTHVWIWYSIGDAALSQQARRLIDDPAIDGWLSPISIWEAGVLQGKGRIRLAPNLRTWVESSFRKLTLRSAPCTPAVALAMFELDLEHRDPADRMLAATAQVYDLTLVTADRRLLALPSLTTVQARS